MLNIKGLDKAEVLKELYNNAKVQGLGFLQASANDMQIKEAREILSTQTDFDYLYGRVMKVNLSSDEEFEEWLYDRDNGTGAAKNIIDELRKKSGGAING